MPGTRLGGQRAAKTNKERYGADFYGRIGAKGGKLSHTGGFYYSMMHGLDTHIKAGQKGGHNSSRQGIKNGQGKQADTTQLVVILHHKKPRRFNLFRRKKV